MIQAYLHLHELGHAHSVEVWEGEELVGGLYGVAVNAVFSGESMFSLKKDASKVALVKLNQWLKEWGYQLIDCQITNKHLKSLGAVEISRKEYIDYLREPKQISEKAWIRMHL